MAPLSLSLRWLSIVASGEGGGHWGRQNPTKGNASGAPPVSKIVKYCDVWGGVIGGRQNPTKDNALPLSVIKIVKYCGVGGGGGGRQNPTKGNARGGPPPSMSVR